MSRRPYAEVIGDPIAHSKSPTIHNFWLRKLGIDAEYRACHVRPGELADYFARRRGDAEWRGCNVTTPHKEYALAMMDVVDAKSEKIGAINTVTAEDGILIGWNTDAPGFLEPLATFELLDASVTIVGAGGAARAVLYALYGHGVGYIAMINRSLEKSQALLNSIGHRSRPRTLEEELPAADLLINASSLGMKGFPPLRLDLSPLNPTAVVYDLVYAPLKTDLLRQAERRGLATIDGLAMLIGQAAAAFEKFFGQPAPREHDAELRALLIQ